MTHSEIVSFLWGVADLIRDTFKRGKYQDVILFGQEVNPETWAVSKSDLFMKDPTGRDADRIAYGSTLSNDRHAGRTFDYLIANPAYGKDWKRDEDAVRAEHERGAAGRFSPGAATDQRRPAAVPAPHARAREGTRGRGLAHCDHHERVTALHRGCGQRRERDSSVHSRERRARGTDRAPGAALLQHGHCDLRVGGDEPQDNRPQGQGTAHEPEWLEYPSLLDLPRPRLRAYRPETAIAEKVHAMVVLGSKNSRMRDFFDVHALCARRLFDGDMLAEAVRATFERRRTALPAETPIALTPPFAEIEGKRAQWTGFLRRNRLLAAPTDFARVVDEVSRFVQPVLAAAVRNGAFTATWPPGGPWEAEA